MVENILQPTSKTEIKALYEQLASGDTSSLLPDITKGYDLKDIDYRLISLDRDFDSDSLSEDIYSPLVSGDSLPRIFHISDFVAALLYGLEAHNIITPNGKITREFVDRGRWLDIRPGVDGNDSKAYGVHYYKQCYDVPPLISELMENRVMWASIVTPFLREGDKAALLEVPTVYRQDKTLADSLYVMLTAMGKTYHHGLGIKKIRVTKVGESVTYHFSTEGSNCDDFTIETKLFGAKIRLSHRNPTRHVDSIRKVGQVVSVKSWLPVRTQLSHLTWREGWRYRHMDTIRHVEGILKETKHWGRFQLEQGCIPTERKTNERPTKRLDGIEYYLCPTSLNPEPYLRAMRMLRGMPNSEVVEQYCIIKEYDIEVILDRFEAFLEESKPTALETQAEPYEWHVYNSVSMEPEDFFSSRERATFSQWMVREGYWLRLDVGADYTMDSGDLGRDIDRLRQVGDENPTPEITDNWWHASDQTHQQVKNIKIMGMELEGGENCTRNGRECNRNKGREIQMPPLFTLKQFGSDLDPTLPVDKDPRPKVKGQFDRYASYRERHQKQMRGEEVDDLVTKAIKLFKDALK